MRLRNNPKANDILAAHDDMVVIDGVQYKNQWHKLFGNNHPIYIEIGMGKVISLLKMHRVIQRLILLGLKSFPV